MEKIKSKEVVVVKSIAFRHRLIGAIFIISLGIIIIPTIFDKPAVDTLAVKESLPAAPSHEKWQDLSEIDYSFTELVGDLQAEEAAAPAPMPTPEPPTALAQATLETTPIELEPTTASPEPLAPLVIQDVTAPEIKAPEIKAPAVSATPPSPPAAPLNLAQYPAEPRPSPEKKAAPATAQAPATDVIKTAESVIVKNTWAVQLGAFSKSENAEALLKRLQEKGYAAYIEPMTGKSLTRVLVGVEADQKKAAQLLTELDRDLHLKGILVKL